jgi:hypothetical protein
MEYVASIQSFVLGPGFISQLLLTVVSMIVLYFIVTLLESIFGTIAKFDSQTAVLFSDTVMGKQIIPQTPDAGNKLIYNSINEKHGMEFSYSMYLYISPDTFEESISNAAACPTAGAAQTTTTSPLYLKHIFHKGSKNGFPLLAPGLFVEGNKNTLRLYMNSTTRWDNFVSIPNIPIGKWFHLVITMKGKYLDVFVNGNVTVRHEFSTVPKLNFGHLYVLYPIKYTSSEISDGPQFMVDGAAKGMVSRLKYYAYALNYAQIDGLYREGPSKKLESASSAMNEVPPYFRDDWWVTKY